VHLSNNYDYSSHIILSIGKQFCTEHAVANTPSIPANLLLKENVERLRKTRSQVKSENTSEDIFNVKGIIFDILVSSLHASFSDSGGPQSSSLPSAPGSSGR
jgi:hypothetical protein